MSEEGNNLPGDKLMSLRWVMIEESGFNIKWLL